MRTFLAFIETLRLHQWTKNSLLFAALVFSRNLDDGAKCLKTLLAFLAFCLISSTVYVLNDVLDRNRDRAHPAKCHRPIASGRIRPGTALAGGVILFIASGVLGFFVNEGKAFPIALAGYFILNLAYSLFLKKMVAADVMTVALGFLIRVIAGGLAIGAPVSQWLIMCTFFGAAMLACCKRRAELDEAGDSSEARAVLADYSLPLLDLFIAVSAASAILAYALYTVSDRTVSAFNTSNLIYTLPLVVYGIFRYLFLVYRRSEGEDPAMVFIKDPGLILAILLWMGLAFVIVYHAVEIGEVPVGPPTAD